MLYQQHMKNFWQSNAMSVIIRKLANILACYEKGYIILFFSIDSKDKL